MGQDVAARVFSRADRQRYREKVRTLPGRVRAHAGRRALRADARIVRPGDRAQPDRRRRPARRWPTPRCSRRSPTPTSRPSSGSSTSRSTSRRGSSRAAVFAELEEAIRGSLNHAEDRSRTVGAHMMIIGILPTHRRRAPQRERAERQPALRAAQRADLRRPRGGPRDRHPRRRAAVDLRRHDRARRRPAPASSCTARSSPTRSPRTGTPRRRSPASRSRWRQLAVLLRQGALARDPHRRSSSRPPTPGPTSSRPRACARACGSASAGSRRSSTSSRRTSATSRPCCRCARTRTRSRR